MQVSDINTAIVSAAKDLGSDILKSATLVGILSDYHAFNVHDPLLSEKKVAISTLAASGYVDKLLKWKQQSGNLWKSEDAQWVEELCQKQGLKRNIVGMIADAMKEAIGLDVSFTEFSNPEKMLSTEMQKYESAAQKLVSTYTDLLGIKCAFYSTSANTELYRHEGFLRILSQVTARSSLNINDWIEKTKKQIIEKSSTSYEQMHLVARKVLSSESTAYEKILKELTEQGKRGKNAFSDISQLQIIADRLNRAFEILEDEQRVNINKDIDAAKRKIKAYRKKRQLLILSIIATVLLMVTFFVIDRINYHKCRTEVGAFNNSITEGDNLLANGSAVEALAIYLNAEKGYTADYRPNHYKSIAQEKQNDASQILFTKGTTKIDSLLYAGKYKEAKLQYDSLSSIGLTIDISEYSNSFKEKLEKNIIEQRELILKGISNNKGKPSQQNSEELDDLLYCMPDDYYLNLIKSKMK